MTNRQIINTQIRAGVWEGEIAGTASATPDIHVTHQGARLAGVTCAFDTARGMWRVKAPIPANMINEGLQTFVVSEAGRTAIAHFTLLAGDALADDLRAEIDLLRCELDLLKAAFRRHCADS